ncbi:VOC family protein [Bradyrhizobium sp. LB11.1]|uniref:VOC family protein n=1 Tax=Bradyrhizobium sp. LB11.1 TaxID=3156326 RepID=UPI0033911719
MKARLDHIGIVVASLEATRAFLQDFGFELIRSGGVPHLQLGAEFLGSQNQNVQIELIEFGDPLIREMRLGGARGRMDHIALEFDDVEEARAVLAERGVQTQGDTLMIVGSMRCYFTRPETSLGVVYQLLDYRGEADNSC